MTKGKINVCLTEFLLFCLKYTFSLDLLFNCGGCLGIIIDSHDMRCIAHPYSENRCNGAMERVGRSQIEWQLRFGLLRSTDHCQTAKEGWSRSQKRKSIPHSLIWLNTMCAEENGQRVRLWFVVLFSSVFVRLQPFVFLCFHQNICSSGCSCLLVSPLSTPASALGFFEVWDQ